MSFAWQTQTLALAVLLALCFLGARSEYTMGEEFVNFNAGLGFNGAQMIYYLILRHVLTTKNCLKSLLI